MGIIRTSTARKGLSKYLRDGYKKSSSFSREEKDFCEPIFGSLDIFEKAEKYLNENKNYSSNYTHITMGYSQRDMAKMDDMSDDERIEFKKNIAEEIIRYYTSGYDQDFEVIAYAESHRPKIKEEKNRVTGEVKERLEHDHIAISHLCPLSNTRLQTAFYNNAFMDSVFQTYINKKYDLDIPRIDGKRTKKDRDFYKIALKNIKNFNALMIYLDDNNLTYKEVRTKKNHYISIVNKEPRNEDEPKRINLNGRGFEHLVFAVANKDKLIPQDIFDKQKENREKTRPEDMKLDELKAILDDFHAKRAKQIRKVRSKASTELLENLQLERDNPVSFNQKEQEKNEDGQYYDEEVEAEKKQQESKIDFEDTVNIELSYSPYKGYKERTFYKYYKLKIGESLHLKGYFIKLKQKTPVFLNKEKGIKVLDRGNVITGECSGESKEQLRELANVMLDVAEAKGWDLRKIKTRGSPEFIKIMKELKSKRIAKKIILGRQNQKKYFTSILSRPSTPLSQMVRENVEKSTIEKEPNVQEIKENLFAKEVIEYASRKYKINKEEYGVTKDNKINNFTNRQKPKSVIDFFIKEVNLSPKEAFAECRRLYSLQLMNNKNTKSTKRYKTNEFTEKQRRAAVHQPSYHGVNVKERRGRTIHDLYGVSNFNLVHSGRIRGRRDINVLLSSNERNNVQQERAANTEVFTADDRTNETSSQTENRASVENRPLSLYTAIDIETIALDTLAIAKVVQEALEDAIDNESFFEYITERFNLKKCGYGSSSDALKFLTQDNETEEMQLSRLGTSFEEIVKKMGENNNRQDESKKDKQTKKNREKRNKTKKNS